MKLHHTLALFLAALPIAAQVPSSSSSSSNEEAPAPRQAAPPRGVEAAGSGITLESNEALFTIAVGLNACGYNVGLEDSLPIRTTIRNEIDQITAQNDGASKARAALCDYVVTHQLTGALNTAQYVSLALYTTQPPELTPSVDLTQIPPDATPVVNVLPLLRTFSEQTDLHFLWVKHRAEYEAAVNQVHDPLTKMILDTNIYLRQPVSSYDGRRFVVLLEPMLGPGATNARVYGSDYFIVTSLTPANKDNPAGVNLKDIRHLYLHYMVEPLIYARASATERLLPVLKAVQDAPLDYAYKNDITAFVAECLIKAIEAHTMDVGFMKPTRPTNVKQRTEIDQYNQDIIKYDRRAEIVRRAQVEHEVHQGWILTEYLYNKLTQMENSNVSLREDIGEMVYGMDVQHEIDHVKNVVFDRVSERDVLARRPPAPRRELTPLEQGEKKLYQNDLAGAESIGQAELAKDPNSDRALYLLARVDILHGKPEEAVEKLNKVVSIEGDPATAKDPETLAWAHIYLGRLYDTREDSREDAIQEYKAALKVNNARVSTRTAAEAGLKKPFTPPSAPEAPAPDHSLPPTPATTPQ